MSWVKWNNPAELHMDPLLVNPLHASYNFVKESKLCVSDLAIESTDCMFTVLLRHWKYLTFLEHPWQTAALSKACCKHRLPALYQPASPLSSPVHLEASHHEGKERKNCWCLSPMQKWVQHSVRLMKLKLNRKSTSSEDDTRWWQ
jgi:hypothetical protein